MQQREVVIAGAGVAGASLAHFLTAAGVRDVLLIEREDAPARHASGRSAEALVEIELDPLWQPLVAEGARFLRRPPPGFAPVPLLRATGEINLLDADGRAALSAALPALGGQGIAVEVLEQDEVRRRHPFITEPDFAGAYWLPDSGRIAVAALIAGYLGSAASGGAELWLDTEVIAVESEAGRVTGVVTTRGPVRCRTLVCAAGAWAGQLGALAGALPIALAPLRRTVVSFDAPDGVDARAWPLVAYESRAIYVAPERDGLLACPMDEDPVAPCDAQPDPARVELALERLGRLAAPLRPQRIRAARAGLRTFAPDRRLVLGDDPVRPGFFWLAGQGGSGIETSPAVGRMAAEIIARGSASDAALAAALSPVRFAPDGPRSPRSA
ncbi:MAG TPA: FAD-binding oxidoreductase [Kofleriaceae bacterium]|nr:FAD-binding oxidoreductase [Kofleriaceae bacterium]